MVTRSRTGTPNLDELEDQPVVQQAAPDVMALMAERRQQALGAALQAKVTQLYGESLVRAAGLEIELGQAGAYIAQLEATVDDLTGQLREALADTDGGLDDGHRADA